MTRIEAYIPDELLARVPRTRVRNWSILAAGLVEEWIREHYPDPGPAEPRVKGPKRSREQLLLASVRHHNAHGRTVPEIATRTGARTGQVRQILQQLASGREDLALQTAAIAVQAPERTDA